MDCLIHLDFNNGLLDNLDLILIFNNGLLDNLDLHLDFNNGVLDACRFYQ